LGAGATLHDGRVLRVPGIGRWAGKPAGLSGAGQKRDAGDASARSSYLWFIASKPGTRLSSGPDRPAWPPPWRLIPPAAAPCWLTNSPHRAGKFTGISK